MILYPIVITTKLNPIIGLIITLAIAFMVGCFTWPYIINTLLDILVNKPPAVTWWQGGLIGMVPGFGWPGIVGCLGIWMFSLFF